MKIVRKTLLILTLVLPAAGLLSSASSAEAKLEATIFSYDGQDFIRTDTTLTAEGQSVVNTRLDRDGSAYSALVSKRSYSGPVTLFGRDFKGHYAPIVGEEGQVIGAVFVGVHN
jgi:hypothetical protein